MVRCLTTNDKDPTPWRISVNGSNWECDVGLPCRIGRGVSVDRRGDKGVVLDPGAPHLPAAL